MSAKPWYAWYPGDWRAKTSALTLAEKGVYRELLDHYFSTGRALPNDLLRLCRISGADFVTEITVVKGIVDEFFTLESDGLLHNNRCDKELIKNKDFKEEQSRKGKLSAAARWGTGGAIAVTKDNRPLTEAVTETQPDCNLPLPQPLSQPQTTTKETKTRRAPKRPVPVDWVPNETTSKRLTTEFALPPDGIDRYTIAFRDICASKGHEYADINAGFANCVRADWPKLRVNGALKPRQKTVLELIEESERQA